MQHITKRYWHFCRYLHLKDSQQQAPRDDPNYDPLYKLRPLVDICHHNFLAHYAPAREMSIDEAMAKYKGQMFFRQYMPKKPTKCVIKVWMISESKTDLQQLLQQNHRIEKVVKV